MMKHTENTIIHHVWVKTALVNKRKKSLLSSEMKFTKKNYEHLHEECTTTKNNIKHLSNFQCCR